MIRQILGLGALMALLGPISCLSDDGPEPFSTEGFCLAGDVEGCPCPDGTIGARLCGDDLHFETACRCNAECSAFPDCGGCGTDCFESCVCERKGHVAECHALCPDSGSSGTP